MMWVRLAAEMAKHPKQLAAGPEAAWLWVCGLCYANTHATDGHLPEIALLALYPSESWTKLHVRKLAARLVSVQLWESLARLSQKWVKMRSLDPHEWAST